MFRSHRTSSRLLLIATLILASLFVGCGSKLISVAESEETLSNWQQARIYQAEGRYPLARQHYLLAAAACNTPDACAGLQHDLETVNLLIRTMR